MSPRVANGISRRAIVAMHEAEKIDREFQEASNDKATVAYRGVCSIWKTIGVSLTTVTAVISRYKNNVFSQRDLSK